MIFYKLEKMIRFKLLFVIQIVSNNPINRLLKSRYFAYTGKISYGLYVYHPVAITLIAKKILTGNIVIDFISCFVMTYMLASLSYFLIEAIFLKLKDKFTD
jgi:peptidoglycan/LPS O-acetylase OafA/YrhL